MEYISIPRSYFDQICLLNKSEIYCNGEKIPLRNIMDILPADTDYKLKSLKGIV